MLTEIKDGDAIFSHAIAIASAEERAAYIARVCGHNAALRRQVEERVAEYFEGGSASEPMHASAAAHSNGHNHEHGSANHHSHEVHDASPHVTHQTGKAERAPRHGSAMTSALLVLLAVVAAASGGLAVMEMRAAKKERAVAEKAVEERDQAQKAAQQVKQQRDEVRTARQGMIAERDQALAEVKQAQQAEQNTKSVLNFIQNNLLSAGHAMGWGGDQIKNLTMRKATDTAAAKVAEAFADRPLVEASVRATLGSAYVDLGEAALAVEQYERAFALREALLGPDDPETGDCRNKLAVAYRLAGRTTEAGRLYDQNSISPSHASALAVRGALLLSQKKPVEAALKLRQCLTIRQKVQPDDWTTFAAKAMLGEALLAQKKFADAEPLLLAGYEGMKQRKAHIPASDKARITKTLERLVQLYEVWGKKDEAARWKKTLQTAEVSRRNAEGSYLRVLYKE